MKRFFTSIDRPPMRLLWEPSGARLDRRARPGARALSASHGLVHVVDPFVTPPEPGRPIYWRLHGISGARSSYHQTISSSGCAISSSQQEATAPPTCSSTTCQGFQAQSGHKSLLRA